MDDVALWKYYSVTALSKFKAAYNKCIKVHTSAISQRVPAVCSAHKDNLKGYGDRSFAVSGPVAWDSLPVALRSSDVTGETSRGHLKTFLFNCLDS